MLWGRHNATSKNHTKQKDKYLSMSQKDHSYRHIPKCSVCATHTTVQTPNKQEKDRIKSMRLNVTHWEQVKNEVVKHLSEKTGPSIQYRTRFLTGNRWKLIQKPIAAAETASVTFATTHSKQIPDRKSCCMGRVRADS